MARSAQQALVWFFDKAVCAKESSWEKELVIVRLVGMKILFRMIRMYAA